MLRKLIYVALSLEAAVTAYPCSAETPAFEGPPLWRDSKSVYLNATPTPAPASTPADQESAEQTQVPASDGRYAMSPQSVLSPPSPTAAPPRFADPAVQLAFHESAAVSVASDGQRRLAPPTEALPRTIVPGNDATASRDLLQRDFPLESISTTLSALAVVIGCFLICTWLVRRVHRKSAAALPHDVVSVLGRVPLAARNVAQLLRVGNKLLLVSITPAGAETLTEVTDPAEVDRLVGLCQQTDPHSTTKTFEHVFRQMSNEPVPEKLLGNELSFGSALRGGAARG